MQKTYFDGRLGVIGPLLRGHFSNQIPGMRIKDLGCGGKTVVCFSALTFHFVSIWFKRSRALTEDEVRLILKAAN